MDDDKVSVSIREIENGYLIDRSWCEKTEGKKGCGPNYDYHHETYYMASLPPLLKKMFTKGKTKNDFGGKEPDGKDGFEQAIDDMDAESDEADTEEAEDNDE